MPPEILEPQEGWTAAEQDIDFWIERRDQERRAYWKAMNQ